MPPTPFHNSSEGSSHVPLGKGWFGDPRRQRGCWEEGAGHEDGGGAEEGEESAMDGVVGGPRVGKERQLPHDVLKIVPKYLHDLVFCLSPFLELIFHFDSLVLFVE